MQRRLFSPQIVESDAFLDMPLSSQALYFHLSMYADDDGFVGSPKRILKMIGGNEDDLKILEGKRFLLTFPTGVVVIKHWLINNWIRPDRYKETKYIEEKKGLIIKENQSYTECQPNDIPNDNQVVVNRLPQVKLSKVKLSKENTIRADKPLKDKFETDKYPKENYKKVLDNYQRIKDLKLQGDEFLPLMAEIKRMFKSNRTVDQIIEAMETCNDLYEDWSMNTVRMKIADVVAGKIRPKNFKPGLQVISTRDI